MSKACLVRTDMAATFFVFNDGSNAAISNRSGLQRGQVICRSSGVHHHISVRTSAVIFLDKWKRLVARGPRHAKVGRPEKHSYRQ
jgi:hypothetical protein